MLPPFLQKKILHFDLQIGISFFLFRCQLQSTGKTTFGRSMLIECASKTCYFPIVSPACKRFNSLTVNFIETIPETVFTTWESIKARFSARSKTDIYLDNLEKSESIDWDKEIDKISECMAKVSPYTPTEIRLKKCIAKCPKEKISELLTKALEHLFLSEKGSLDELYRLIDNKLLEKSFGPTSELVKELSHCLPPIRTAPAPSFLSRLGKILRVVARFFPRFMDTLLKAFNLIEIGKGPETPWDFYAVLSIYFKLFMVPYALFLSVAALVSAPAQALFLSAGVLLLIS